MVSELALSRAKQVLASDEIHRWYRFVLAYPDHLVQDMIERFDIVPGQVVLDPFCGTGTTLVECKKRGIDSIGIDANPIAVLASDVKTNWHLNPDDLEHYGLTVLDMAGPALDALTYSIQPLFASGYEVESLKQDLLFSSPEGQYFISSGMLKRNWVSETPFYKTLALLRGIKQLDAPEEYAKALKLVLVATLVESVANVSFGPEVYVSKARVDAPVGKEFQKKIREMVSDLRSVSRLNRIGNTRVLFGDARNCDVLHTHSIDRIDSVITSPPYITEKDYTRQTRLELVFLGMVWDSKSLRAIKKQMLRSHSKGIYKNDRDGELVADLPEVKSIADELREKVADKTYGFAKLYPRIIEEYFGGMYRHLMAIAHLLRPGGACAYVVGDQRTYLQTYTPIAKILGVLARKPEVGLMVEDTVVWRVRKGTTGSGQTLNEHILILRKP